jgi:biopolymer transport protein TolQ
LLSALLLSESSLQQEHDVGEHLIPSFFWAIAAQTELPTGLQGSVTALAAESDIVVQIVLFLLGSASLVSWGIILTKVYQLWTARKASQRFASIFWGTEDLSSIHTASLELQDSPTAVVFQSGYQLLQQEKQRAAPPASSTEANASLRQLRLNGIEQVVRRTQQEQESRLERRLLHLATVSSAAPFVGLFGTVWGIMNAFRGLSSAQASSIQAVAPGIAQALIATAVGLAAAIPAVVAYNYFNARVQEFAEAMDNVINRFLLLAQRSF